MILTHTLILWEEKKHGEGVAAADGGGLVREEETSWDPQPPDKLWPIASLAFYKFFFFIIL
jgi:hypothetical protein